MAYKLPKAFKPASLDTEAVDVSSLNSSKTQLWHFTFPLDFNVAGFSELELHLPADPISSVSQVPQMVASFELDGASYRIIEGSVFETADLVNLFPVPVSAGAGEPATLQPGKPFTRSFRVCRDILFPAPPTRPLPINPLGRAPRQLQGMRKNFLPVGFMHESFGRHELEAGDKQGRVLRSGSARPSSPRLLPNHGFDLGEWKPLGGKKSAAASSSSSSASAAEEAARKAAKKEKKEAKRRADALSSGSAATPAAEASNKKQRTDAESKKKKKDKH